MPQGENEKTRWQVEDVANREPNSMCVTEYLKNRDESCFTYGKSDGIHFYHSDNHYISS